MKREYRVYGDTFDFEKELTGKGLVYYRCQGDFHRVRFDMKYSGDRVPVRGGPHHLDTLLSIEGASNSEGYVNIIVEGEFGKNFDYVCDVVKEMISPVEKAGPVLKVVPPVDRGEPLLRKAV